ncbi:MAG: hypothetical protein RL033_3958 [Pseudomonadota bacterium]
MFIRPLAPPYDPLVWAAQPFATKSRMVCQAWALQGYGSPLLVYAAYGLKLLAYVAGWVFFCSRSPGLGGLDQIARWWLTPLAFQKAILWSLLFEILGLGCGSGPLTGRYWPPLGGALYFLRPGTTKLPVFPGLRWIGGQTRSWLDVALYAAHAALLLAALLGPEPTRAQLCGIAVLLGLLGVLDKTLFLAARAEHYWTTLLIFVLAGDFIPGAKGVQAALWFWAGVSKLNHHFPAVVGVMTSNSPVLRSGWLRRLMYRAYPHDLSPSRSAVLAGHAGTLLELAVPVVLLTGEGGTTTLVGLALMLALHGFITSNVPMGVPLEWNVMMVYGGFFLFWRHAGTSVLATSAPVALVLCAMCVALPVLGNLWPARVPFLLAMRYYAGNWAFSVWLFRKGSERKLRSLVASSGWIYDQLERLYDRSTSIAVVGKIMGFRLMHLHGRALPRLVPKAVERFEDYEWLDGEVVAGMVLGWNFGDGHLHREQLLSSVQAQCAFEPGELRCVMVEAQPLGRDTLHYRILDASTGLLEQGHVSAKELRQTAPWAAE